jgi:hypothetical protein
MSVFDQLQARHPDVRFELYPTVKGDQKRVYLTGFIVPYDKRGTGLGTDFMNDLINTADENGFKITLTPSNSYGGNVTRLKSFYKGFGFVDHKGNNMDFSHKEDMYKYPKGLNENNIFINKMEQKDLNRLVEVMVFINDDLVIKEEKEKKSLENTAIIRLEQLYPLPVKQLKEIINNRRSIL